MKINKKSKIVQVIQWMSHMDMFIFLSFYYSNEEIFFKRLQCFL
jgi:hypothetical protein